MTVAAELVDVSQVFGDFAAVDHVDLTIEEGRFTTLLGPSGCGKTTTLRMLAGYLMPTSGRIRIGGVDATRTPPEKRDLGMVFQSYALFPHMSVAENVGYGLKLRRVPRAARRERVAETLDLVGLRHLATAKPGKLSGGQQQRVALARAIAIRPRLMLLDEPLSNLDARLRLQMRAELRRIQAETGLTIVLVTHDQDEALELSDEMVLMQDGHVMQHGSPREVFPAPANRFAAEFLGYENFLTTADGATLTVRPEHVDLATEVADAPAGALTVPATVVDVAYRGVDMLVTLAAVDPSGADVKLLADVRAGAAGPLAAGDRAVATISASRLVTLPA
ncbi:ABC transporter ATP-binding protein [Georgenia halophila]|uniref:ABC transporter ATP-binding protein n=1 Tax=Georgenia halophila TaxID=620889 RepID=A0ABP8LMQ3_9MICO